MQAGRVWRDSKQALRKPPPSKVSVLDGGGFYCKVMFLY